MQEKISAPISNMYLSLIIWCMLSYATSREIEKHDNHGALKHGEEDQKSDEHDLENVWFFGFEEPNSTSEYQAELNENLVDENLPARSFMDDPNTKWRYGPPDYSLVNEKYLAEKTKNHLPGSLEKTVENLVKTWEMESEHKSDVNDWRCVVPDEYKITVNGHCTFNISDTLEIGNYNILLMDSPLYNARNETRASSRKTFKTAFPGAFAFEVLEVFSGPPKVAFTWHHWADWTGPYKNVSSTGEKIDLYGSCIATVTDDLKITDLQVFYDSATFMGKLQGMELGCPHV